MISWGLVSDKLNIKFPCFRSDIHYQKLASGSWNLGKSENLVGNMWCEVTDVLWWWYFQSETSWVLRQQKWWELIMLCEMSQKWLIKACCCIKSNHINNTQQVGAFNLDLLSAHQSIYIWNNTIHLYSVSHKKVLMFPAFQFLRSQIQDFCWTGCMLLK